MFFKPVVFIPWVSLVNAVIVVAFSQIEHIYRDTKCRLFDFLILKSIINAIFNIERV